MMLIGSTSDETQTENGGCGTPQCGECAHLKSPPETKMNISYFQYKHRPLYMWCGHFHVTRSEDFFLFKVMLDRAVHLKPYKGVVERSDEEIEAMPAESIR